jgi:ATP-dependent DNA helicase RecG
VAENRGSGISMMISQVRRDTGLVPLFAASLDEFRVTIPRTSLITPELRAWAGRLSRGQGLSEAQISVLALASAGHDVDIALTRRLGLGPSDARRQLSQLRDLGLLQPRRARDDGFYRLAVGLSGIKTRDAALPLPGNGLAKRILAALRETDSASREELQEATGASRSSVTNALDDLITLGAVEATAPPRSPNRRYRRTRP